MTVITSHIIGCIYPAWLTLQRILCNVLWDVWDANFLVRPPSMLNSIYVIPLAWHEVQCQFYWNVRCIKRKSHAISIFICWLRSLSYPCIVSTSMVHAATNQGVSLTQTQWKVASQTAKSKRQQLKEAMDGVLRMINERVAHLAIEHKWSPAYLLEQIHQGSRFSRRKRGPNIFNAAQHAMGLVEKPELKDGA